MIPPAHIAAQRQRVQELEVAQRRHERVLRVDLGGEVGVWCVIGERERVLVRVEIGWREGCGEGCGKCGRGYRVGSFEAGALVWLWAYWIGRGWWGLAFFG